MVKLNGTRVPVRTPEWAKTKDEKVPSEAQDAEMEEIGTALEEKLVLPMRTLRRKRSDVSVAPSIHYTCSLTAIR